MFYWTTCCWLIASFITNTKVSVELRRLPKHLCDFQIPKTKCITMYGSAAIIN